MKDRRTALIEAGLQILREDGLAGLTQAKVAARVHLKQGHLTYYFPTRADLLAAIAHAAIDMQIGVAERLTDSLTPEGGLSNDAMAGLITDLTLRHENSRVLLALNQAADGEPEVRALFNSMNQTVSARIRAMLERLGIGADDGRVDMLHALFVGLMVIELGTSRPGGRERNRAAIKAALDLMTAPPR